MKVAAKRLSQPSDSTSEIECCPPPIGSAANPFQVLNYCSNFGNAGLHKLGQVPLAGALCLVSENGMKCVASCERLPVGPECFNAAHKARNHLSRTDERPV